MLIDMDMRLRARSRALVCLLVLALLGTVTTAAAAPRPAPPATATAPTNTANAAATARWGDRRLDEVAFLATHNAFTNYEDSRWSSVNQSESVRAQLDNGVRGLSLDTHWYERSTWLCVISFGSDCYPSDVYLCHGDCKTFAGATYALPRQTFHGTMQTVVDFLATHPQEVVTVFLEDYVGADQLQASLGRVNGLQNMLFRADEWGVRQHGWPKVADLVTSGKRLLIFSDRSDREHLGRHVRQVLDREQLLEPRGPGQRRLVRQPLGRRAAGPSGARIPAPVHDEPPPQCAHRPHGGPDNGAKLRNRIAEQCRSATGGRDPNFVSVDFHRLSDGSGHTPASVVAELNARP